MKRILLTLLLGLLITNCSNAGNEHPKEILENNESAMNLPGDGDKGFIKNVTPEEFKALVDKGEGIILDVRTPQETSQGHIENASLVNVYDEDFVNKINLMQKDKAIYVYCKSGARSAKAAEILSQNGFTQIYNLSGGIMAWENKGYPITKPIEGIDSNINTVSVEDFNKMLASGKPVLVDFHTQWCAPCKKMAPIIDEVEKEFKEKAIVMRIDADASKELAKAYQIQGVPEFFLFLDGEQIWKHNGIIEKEKIVEQLNAAIK